MFNFANLRNSLGGSPANNPNAELVAGAEEGRVTVIDVRNHNEVARSGKARGALNIPLMVLQHQADPRHPECHADLDTSKPVAVYCASGARSQMAMQILLGLGYADVKNVGGLGDWTRAGGQIG